MRTNILIFLCGAVFGVFMTTVTIKDASASNKKLKPAATVTSADAAEFVESAASKFELPVYKFLGRMDLYIANPEAVAYIMERGNQIEYVPASKVKTPVDKGSGYHVQYFVKTLNGEYFILRSAND